jgi:hypothetical protein
MDTITKLRQAGVFIVALGIMSVAAASDIAPQVDDGAVVQIAAQGEVSSPPADAVSTPSPAEDAAAVEELTFFDSYSFDKDLSDQLKLEPVSAVVLPSGPFTPNQIPPRLEKWLSAVAKSGGKVKLKKDAGAPTRGFLSDMVDLKIKADDASELAALYATAQKYDVIVSYSGSNVTSIHFSKRPIPAEEKKTDKKN